MVSGTEYLWRTYSMRGSATIKKFVVGSRYVTFRLFFGDGGCCDESDEALAIALRRNGGDLTLQVRETFPKVFRLFDEAILQK